MTTHSSKEYNRKWRESNRLHVRELGLNFAKKHRREIADKSMVYYYNHRDERLEYAARKADENLAKGHLIKCSCGLCNELINSVDVHGKPRRFAIGHKGKKYKGTPEERKKQARRTHYLKTKYGKTGDGLMKKSASNQYAIEGAW